MSLFSWFARSPRRSEVVCKPESRRLCLEPLEDRLTPAPLAYSVRPNGAAVPELFRLDLAINNQIPIGPSLGAAGTFGVISGLALSPVSGTLYGIDESSDRLITINTTTGAGNIGTLGLLGVDVTDVGLASDSNGNLFMVDAGTMSLYRVSTTTGLATLIGATGSLGRPVTGLAIDRTGNLFGITNDMTPQLVRINSTNGTLTTVGAGLGIAIASAGLDFDDRGTLFGIDSGGDIFTVNTTTGVGTVTVVTGVAGFQGLATIPPPVVPTPPAPTPTGGNVQPLPSTFAIGTNPNTQGFVKIYGEDVNERFIINAFPGFTGPVHTSTGDVTGDGVADAIVSVAGNGPAHVKVFDGKTGAELVSFLAFNGFTGGVNVAAADVNHDGFDDLIVGTASGFSHVQVFDIRNNKMLASFIAFPGYGGGVSVAGGDVNGDGFDDVIVGSAQAAAAVKVYAGGVLNAFAPLASFIATDNPGFGIEVGAGDFDGDGRAEIVVAISGPATVLILNSKTGAVVYNRQPYAGYGGRIGVDAFDVDGDGRDELLTTTLTGPVHAILSKPLSDSILSSFIAFPSVQTPVGF